MRRHDRLARVIDKACTVRIAIETNAQIRRIRLHGLRQTFIEFRQKRIRNAVRKTAVWLGIKKHRLQAEFLKPLCYRLERHRTYAVARRNDNFQATRQRLPFIKLGKMQHHVRKFFCHRHFLNW